MKGVEQGYWCCPARQSRKPRVSQRGRRGDGTGRGLERSAAPGERQGAECRGVAGRGRDAAGVISEGGVLRNRKHAPSSANSRINSKNVAFGLILRCAPRRQAPRRPSRGRSRCSSAARWRRPGCRSCSRGWLLALLHPESFFDRLTGDGLPAGDVELVDIVAHGALDAQSMQVVLHQEAALAEGAEAARMDFRFCGSESQWEICIQAIRASKTFRFWQDPIPGPHSACK